MSEDPASVELRDDFVVQVLGPIRVLRQRVPLDIGGPKPQLILAMLVVAKGRVVSTDELIYGLWSDAPPTTARKTLQANISRLRRVLGGESHLQTTHCGYRFETEEAFVDLSFVQQGVQRASELMDVAPSEARDVLTKCLKAWRGRPFAGLEFEQALIPVVAGLDELYLRARELRIEADLRLGRHREVLDELCILVAEHPVREDLCAQQMVALYRSGRQVEALRCYERARRFLASELGVMPTSKLRWIEQEILAHRDPTTLEPSLMAM